MAPTFEEKTSFAIFLLDKIRTGTASFSYSCKKYNCIFKPEYSKEAHQGYCKYLGYPEACIYRKEASLHE